MLSEKIKVENGGIAEISPNKANIIVNYGKYVWNGCFYDSVGYYFLGTRLKFIYSRNRELIVITLPSPASPQRRGGLARTMLLRELDCFED